MTEPVLFPQVTKVEKTEDSLVLQLIIPNELHYFLGHFPQSPILPGVVQVHWVLHYLAEHFGTKVSDYQSIDALKFQVIIAPEYQVSLALKKVNDTKYSFNYSSEHGTHSSGKVAFKS